MLRSSERLRILRGLLQSDEELQVLTSRHAVFFERDGSWHLNNARTVTIPFWRKTFNRALLEPTFLVAGGTVVRGFGDLAVVVAARLAPQAADEGERVDRIIRRLVHQTEHQFAADFDKLTNAPNRRRLERSLDGLARSVAEFSSTASRTHQAVVMMLDLDNFKQANDSGGHDFGDALLQVTAWRLLEFGEALGRSGVARDVCAGRWGGEEFILAGLFPADPEVISTQAAALVKAFAEPPMPSPELDVPKLRKLARNPTAMFDPPKPPVTASLGWSLMTVATEEEELPVVVQQVIARADAAMYRAKLNGKNRAVAFSDIAERHGRVLVHRTDAGIVVLDIGAFTGVKRGDVFDVYPDDFATQRDYIFRDGRTERALGPYPRLPVARIRVETTPERDISFCSILRLRKGVGQLSEKAHVQLVKPAIGVAPVSEATTTPGPTADHPSSHE